MYSLNVPVPGRLKRLAAELHPRLASFERVRERHSLVCKRFESGEPNRLYKRTRRALGNAPAFEARTARIESFENPVRGPGPVVYLAVESPGLFDIHDRLVEAFGAIPFLEGTEYVPHVTLARGGSTEQASDLCALDIEPIEWTVTELGFYDATHDELINTMSLPLSP
ncbi:MAG TPA: 2'-5' RNA ligase family protein [Halococcus sp.]|nr:2'-5' RNA ligase family protein [Halococcus sp.]